MEAITNTMTELTVDELEQVEGGSVLTVLRVGWEALGHLGRLGTAYEVASFVGGLGGGEVDTGNFFGGLGAP